jgi:hypothetical protein
MSTKQEQSWQLTHPPSCETPRSYQIWAASNFLDRQSEHEPADGQTKKRLLPSLTAAASRLVASLSGPRLLLANDLEAVFCLGGLKKSAANKLHGVYGSPFPMGFSSSSSSPHLPLV